MPEDARTERTQRRLPLDEDSLTEASVRGLARAARPARLLCPLIRGRRGDFEEVSWGEAMELLTRRIGEILGRYSAESVAILQSGQLSLEEDYTLSILALAGLGTRNRDSGSRFFGASGRAALEETFGADVQPGRISAIDSTECLFSFGHDLAETHPELWNRFLRRRRGPRPPRLIVADPRETPVAREADLHLAPSNGTYVALLNGLMHLMIRHASINQGFIDERTVGFDELTRVCAEYPPKRVEEITGVPAGTLHQAAALLESVPSLVSTTHCGVYQGNQATAACVQINNLHLLRGLIDEAGCAILRMGGGGFAGYPAGLNFDNPVQMRRLARHWNVDLGRIPCWAEPSHAMEIIRLAEQGIVRMLWVIGEDPVISLPGSNRIRRILSRSGLFLAVQDSCLSETATLADLVLPAAIPSEKMGVFMGPDRTVGFSPGKDRPPGQARADLEIFLEVARRMDFRDRNGMPLIHWRDPEGAFRHLQELSRGTARDLSGIRRETLSDGDALHCLRGPWFPTRSDICRTFGHDLETGGGYTETEYRAGEPAGRAILRAARYQPPIESPDASYPFLLVTSMPADARSVIHVPPEPLVQLACRDAARLGVKPGDRVRLMSRRGALAAIARVGGVREGHVVVPFHLGFHDEDGLLQRGVGELVPGTWDPISGEPCWSSCALQIYPHGAVPLAERAARHVDAGKAVALRAGERLLSVVHLRRSRLSDYLGLLISAHQQFIQAGHEVSLQHFEELDIRLAMRTVSEYSATFVRELAPFAERYGAHPSKEPGRIRQAVFPVIRISPFGLVRDLHGLLQLCSEAHLCLTMVAQASRAMRDAELEGLCKRFEQSQRKQERWLLTQLKRRGPWSMVVPA